MSVFVSLFFCIRVSERVLSFGLGLGLGFYKGLKWVEAVMGFFGLHDSL